MRSCVCQPALAMGDKTDGALMHDTGGEKIWDRKATSHNDTYQPGLPGSRPDQECQAIASQAAYWRSQGSSRGERVHAVWQPEVQ